MFESLKMIFENGGISEKVQQEIQEAWDERIKENRKQVTAELREEFAKKYEHDKGFMIEAIDKLISERLAEEIEEFRDDRSQLAKSKARYAMAIREHSELLKNFVFSQLTAEVQELHQDRKKMNESVNTLKDFVVESLAGEIAEFYQDKQALVETKIKMIRESKSSLNKIKRKFIENSAMMVSRTVDKTLRKELSQFKEDIYQARQNDFGRKLFEAFAMEYAGSYLNEKSETSKLLKVINLKDEQLAEARVYASKALKLAESQRNENRHLLESTKRTNILAELTAPLSHEHKEIMLDLLESVQTNKLRNSFEKYLPAVIDEKQKKSTKKNLNESKEVTGNREYSQNNFSRHSDDANVIDIRRLAGLN